MSEDQNLQFGTYLTQLRNEAGLSMNALAELADVNVAYISRIERGIKTPAYEVIRRLQPHLNASLVEMLVKAGRLPDGSDLLDDKAKEILERMTSAKRKILYLLDELDDHTIDLVAQTLDSLLNDRK